MLFVFHAFLPLYVHHPLPFDWRALLSLSSSDGVVLLSPLLLWCGAALPCSIRQGESCYLRTQSAAEPRDLLRREVCVKANDEECDSGASSATTKICVQGEVVLLSSVFHS